MNLEGKVAIVTGGGTGIGRAIAERFIADGASVCITGRRPEVLEAAAASAAAGRIKACAADVTDQAGVERMVETTLEFGRGLNILVNNAGIEQPLAGVADLDPAVWNRVVEVNLTGPFLMMKAAIPRMVEAGGGSIINISSVAGIVNPPRMPAYVASKGGLLNLTKQVAVDYAGQNIRCNAVCPGGTRTEMMVSAMTPFAAACGMDLDDVVSAFSRDVPMKRVSSPEEMAGLCSYLASDDASFLTGAVIPVDGGASLVDISGVAINQLAAERLPGGEG